MILTIVLFVAILGLLVFVHELGHFLTAKRAGATVLEFGFGFPPRLFGIRRKGTIYSMNWIPVGGFVKIKGEGGEDTDAPDSFANLATWKRAGIVLSGVAMNVLLAMFLFSFIFAAGAPTTLEGDFPAGAQVSQRRIQILGVDSGSPAERANLRLGDTVVSLDGKPVATVEEVQSYNAAHEGVEELLEVQRGKATVQVRIAPEKYDGAGAAIWGVNLAETGIVRYPWYVALWLGVKTAVVMLWNIILAFFGLLRDLVVSQRLSGDIAGPIGIAALTGQVASLGFIHLIQFAALLSLNLAVINALPFPALDGGRALFLAIEKFRGKKVNIRIETIIHNVGFFLLLLLVLAVTIRDVMRVGGKFLNTIGSFFTGGS